MNKIERLIFFLKDLKKDEKNVSLVKYQLDVLVQLSDNAV